MVFGHTQMLVLVASGALYSCDTGFDGYARGPRGCRGCRRVRPEQREAARATRGESRSGARARRRGRAAGGKTRRRDGRGAMPRRRRRGGRRVYAFGCGALGGEGRHGEPRLVRDAPERAVDVAAGEYFTLALGEDGDLVGWGDGKSGQLGVDPAMTNEWTRAARRCPSGEDARAVRGVSTRRRRRAGGRVNGRVKGSDGGGEDAWGTKGTKGRATIVRGGREQSLEAKLDEFSPENVQAQGAAGGHHHAPHASTSSSAAGGSARDTTRRASSAHARATHVARPARPSRVPRSSATSARGWMPGMAAPASARVRAAVGTAPRVDERPRASRAGRRASRAERRASRANVSVSAFGGRPAVRPRPTARHLPRPPAFARDSESSPVPPPLTRSPRLARRPPWYPGRTAAPARSA